MEKILLSVMGVAGMALVVTAVLVVRPEDKGDQWGSRQARQEDVCVTPECAIAAAEIIQNMDITTEPCDDFYRFACGGWMDSNVIPDGKSKWGPFYVLRDLVDSALEAIVTSEVPSASSSVNSLKAMFNGCLDTEAIEAAGVSGILSSVGESGDLGGWPMIQDSWTDAKFDLSAAVGQQRRYLDLSVLLSVYVYLDDFNTEQNVVYVDQPGLGLPQSMYLDVDSYAEYIAAYKTFMVDTGSVLVRELGSGVSDETLMAKADEVFEFERQIAMVMTPDSERRNSTAMYNPMMISELKDNYPRFNWDAYFEAVFADTEVTVGDDERVIVVQPDYFEASQNIEASTEVLANYVYWRSMMTLDGDLTEELRDIAFNFRAVMTGVNTATPRSNTCLAKSVSAWGFAAAHEYVLSNFDEATKAQADSMVEDLRSAFKELVEETDWMDSETQVKAEEKADLMLQLIGYPDWLVDVEKVDGYYGDAPASTADNHLGNVLGMKNWGAKQDLISLRMEPTRDVWLMHPAIVNAWYSPNHNTITFPAGILQAPFFKGGWPRYLNYGAMGMVIGHEITHGFDDQGRQYDGTGSLNPWWSPETIDAFSVQAQCFIDQYSNYTVPELEDILGEDAHLNGKNTQGENIADNGGIHESFRAYMRSVESQGQEPALPGLTQFTSEQMFFISNAQVWCEIATTESLLGQVLGDPHSPGKFRVIGPLGNSEDFQREFSCPAGSAMNREDKCRLW
eukprot:GFUD01037162.1.p1 GENE.GFUD01037162.1~~GFUD01037162.1.p1  ORF type:complete len:770 (-),score=219.06 GFUD01037162.1:48-2252(-)